MIRFRYPVDTDQFAEIREKGLVYVDKTDLMFDLVDRYKYVFLARPRRFGKSLLCNTFKAYFQGQKNLFEGLKIMELEKEWKTYPVLHFTMSGLKNLKVSEAKTKLENLIPMPLLYQSGYLTIDSYDPLLKTYTLHFPNLEVREGMVSGLMPLILRRSVADGNTLTRNMASSLFKGNLPGALTALRSYIAKIPYDIITKEEWDDKESRESFYKLLMYMAFSMLNSIVDTEVKSVLGRADVVIKTKNDIFVLELKVDDTVDNALAQINSKGYAIPYESDGRKVTKCGVSISSEARNIVHWRSIDEEGNIIDEQTFSIC